MQNSHLRLSCCRRCLSQARDYNLELPNFGQRFALDSNLYVSPRFNEQDPLLTKWTKLRKKGHKRNSHIVSHREHLLGYQMLSSQHSADLTYTSANNRL